MSNISLKNDGEDHNFWQNYTDLMSGLLIVFIIAALIGIKTQTTTTQIEPPTPIEPPAQGPDDTIRVTVLQYNLITAFEESAKKLNSRYFSYKPQYKRFELINKMIFDDQSYIIKEEFKDGLIAAGNDMQSIIKDLSSQYGNYVSFKIIIDGRTANWISTPSIEGDRNWKRNEVLSYYRALELKDLWRSQNIFKSDKDDIEVIVSGSGFGGIGRYPKEQEDDNKTIIVQIIPYIKPQKTK